MLQTGDTKAGVIQQVDTSKHMNGSKKTGQIFRFNYIEKL